MNEAVERKGPSDALKMLADGGISDLGNAMTVNCEEKVSEMGPRHGDFGLLEELIVFHFLGLLAAKVGGSCGVDELRRSNLKCKI